MKLYSERVDHKTIEFGDLQRDARARPFLYALGACALCLLFIVYAASTGRSLVLTNCSWLCLFSMLSLGSGLTSVLFKNATPNARMSYGLARAPVLAIFSCTTLAQLSSLFIVKEAVEHLLEEEEPHPHSHILFIPAVLAATVAQLISAYAVKNEPMLHVLTAASSSWLQEHAADVSTSLCHVMPGLAQFLLPRINAFGLLCSCSVFICMTTHILLNQGYAWADPLGALCLSLSVIGSLFPLSSYTGRILLQTTPSYMLSQIQRYLNEARTLDGVLEVTGSNFWQLDFNRMVGTVVVRVKRDADEQLALVQVTEKLSAAVSDLTVQIIKTADIESLSAGHGAVGQHSPSWNDFGSSDHGHSHGSGGQDHGHSHNGGMDHGHSHGAGNDHGHSHGGGNDHGHSHGGSANGHHSVDLGAHGHAH